MKYGMSQMKSSSVVSLTILDDITLSSSAINDETKILIGVRNAETNITDPNVVSVPTQRVPPSLLKEICSKSHKAKINENFGLNFPENFLQAHLLDAPVVDNRQVSGHDSTIYAVESVLTGKLGLADALESGNIHFTASPASLLVGSVLYDKITANLPGRPIKVREQELHQEYQEMCNIRVILSGAEYVPKSTASYSALRWIDVHKFMEMTRSKDYGLLLSVFGRQAVGYCVHGLCLTSSYMYLRNELHR